ncbi:MAG: hypothetical protein ABL983_05355 [Nitrospira sp.]
MSSSQSSAIFESFNARALKPSEVAMTFVPSMQYKQLIKRCHTIIIGPRGSGKTTLLKMLQQAALENWDHPAAEEYRQQVDYTGVFIATDVSWGGQIQSLGEGRLDADSHKCLSIAAFTTHVLRSLIIAMLHRVSPPIERDKHPFRRATLSNDSEVQLARFLANAWHVKPTIPSLFSLKQSLSLRLSEIREIANREVVLGKVDRAERLSKIPFLHMHFVESTTVATDCFNDLTGDFDGKWALMFDELELAPPWIQAELVRSLRSTDAKFLYKLAMSPLSHTAALMETPLSAAPDQDFEQIQLWYVEKNESSKFCKDLWESMLKARGIESRAPKSVLGISNFEPLAEEGVESAYSPGSRSSKRFVSLAAVDASFQSYLSEKRIDPSHLDQIPKPQMDSIVRKIAPLVAIREYYRAPDRMGERKIITRTRKSAALYGGADSLFAVSEGNPRWFIAIVGRLLDKWQDHSLEIPARTQADEMIKAAQRFSAMLKTIPAPQLVSYGSKRGVQSLVNVIARYFHRQIVVEDFIAEPPSTFIVDSHVSEDVEKMLGQALNAGALVYVPDNNGQLLLRSLRGKRFRISYLLAPLYGLPLRLGVPQSLSRVLSTKDASDDKDQLLLGEGE